MHDNFLFIISMHTVMLSTAGAKSGGFWLAVTIYIVHQLENKSCWKWFQ